MSEKISLWQFPVTGRTTVSLGCPFKPAASALSYKTDLPLSTLKGRWGWKGIWMRKG